MIYSFINIISNIKVTFVGEGAVDYGGPRREFFRLLASEAATKLLHGNDFRKFFLMNATAFQVTYSCDKTILLSNHKNTFCRPIIIGILVSTLY